MHQARHCAFLDHSCPGAADEPAWDHMPLAAAAYAYLLSRWIAEDAPPGARVPGLHATGGAHGHRNDSPDDWANLATVYETGLFPHIDPDSGTARQALGCRPLDEDELRKSVTAAVLRPWHDQATEPSPRVAALLGELLGLLTEWRSEFRIVEAVDFTDSLPTPGELHVLSATSTDVIRLSVLDPAPDAVRRGGLTPHPGCAFGGHGCAEGHLLSDTELDRAHTALRAMSAGTVLSMHMPVNNNTHISFSVRLAPHGLAAPDATTAAAWLEDSPWNDELADWEVEFNTVFDEDSWRTELADFRTECRETYSMWFDEGILNPDNDADYDAGTDPENDTHDPAPVSPDLLADALLHDLLDAPVARITAATPTGDTPVHAAASMGEYGWFDIEQRVYVALIGPEEAMFLRIDGVA
ncbi:hypothetical protein [Yinghuangia sp. YIM S09857]|uniref:hypothetical protein n=1 Tax=Yinghuangia sp. YIM S09857 TaxID=3436929 RepID=UPI003F530793